MKLDAEKLAEILDSVAGDFHQKRYLSEDRIEIESLGNIADALNIVAQRVRKYIEETEPQEMECYECGNESNVSGMKSFTRHVVEELPPAPCDTGNNTRYRLECGHITTAM